MSTNQNVSSNQNKNEEEVDLGSLFIIIGKGFSKVFNFIGSIFKGIFHGIISTLVFLKNNSIKIGIAAIIGFAVGVFLEVKTPNRFGSDMLVQPNFKSARQLYNNINYYNDLVKQKDTAGIQKTFFLDKATAASIKKFTIEPIINNNDIIDAYKDFILEVDTLIVKSYPFEDFKVAFTELDYKIHKITVIAEKNDVFNKLDEVILSSIVRNKYFSRLKELNNENLNRTDLLYRKNLVEVDSLRKVYMQVMVEEAKKQTSGTNIDLGGEKGITKEIELFETNRKINENLKDISIYKSEKYEIINVISNFQPIGYEVKGIIKNKALQLAVLAGLVMIFILLLIKVDRYLGNYNK